MAADEAWGQVGVVLLTEYDHLGHLKRLESEVGPALELLASMGFEVIARDVLSVDGRASSLQAAIGHWRPPGRRLVLYWAGHGKAIEGGRLFLGSRETVKDRQPESHNAVPAGNLGDLLAGKDAQEIVLILDACGSGGGAEEIVAAFRAKTESRAYPSGFRPGLSVISSAGRKQFAREGAFSRALVSVLRDGPPADPSYLPWTDRDQYLTPAEVFQAVRVQLARAPKRGVQTPDHDATSGVGRFFPNPRYRTLLPDIGVAEKQRRGALLPSAVAEHFMLKFRGIDTVDDQGWFFTGRERLLRRLVSWLKDDRPGMVVITGAPGSGKSALLGRLAVLSVPGYRKQVERAGGLRGVPADTLPPTGSLDAGVHVKNLTLAECVGELADALQLPAPAAGWRSAADFVRQVASLRRPVTLLVDALDEAQPADVNTIAAELLRPLAEVPAVKLLVGTRPDQAMREVATGPPSPGTLLHALDAPASDTIWLDRDNDARSDIEDYVARRLLESHGSPYAGQQVPARAAARVVAERSDRVFLIARLLTRELVQRQGMVNLDDRGPDASANWLMLERGIGAAFAADLARFGRDEARLRELLAPLAFAEGAGLPGRDVWLSLARALRPDDDGPVLAEADLGWALTHAGAYLIESGEDGQTVYRLYHQAFADYFRRTGRPATQAQQGITDALLSLVPRDTQRRWNLANPYLLRHLATHAAQARRLEELTGDSGYLLYAEPQRLQRALAASPYSMHPLVRLYLRCVDELAGTDPSGRGAILQGVALRDEPEALALLSTEAEVPWRGLWSVGQRAAFHRRLPSHASPVTAVAFGEVRRTALLATAAGDGVVRLWNPATGEQWGRFGGQGGTVFALAFDGSGLRRLLVTGSQDGSVGFWDPDDGRLIRSVPAHRGPVFAVALAETIDGPLLATGGDDGLIRLWDPDTGQPNGVLYGHHTAVRTLTFGAEAGHAILVSGGDDGRARIWRPRSLRQIREFRATGWIYALALGHVDDRPVLATSSAFGMVRLWDRRTGEHLLKFVGHTGSVNTLAFGTLHDRTLLATGGDDGAIRLWDPRDGSSVQTLTRSTPIGVTDMGSGPAPAPAAIGSGLSRAADPDPGPDTAISGYGRSRSVQSIAWGTVSGTAILASGDGDWSARLWDTSVGGVAEPQREVGLVRTLAAGSVHGFPTIVAGGDDGKVRLYEAWTGRHLRVLDVGRAVLTLALGVADGRPILASGAEDGVVTVWDAVTGDPIHRLNLRGPAARAAFAEAVLLAEVAGRAVAVTAAGYGGIASWDVLSGQGIRTLRGAELATRLAFGVVDGRPKLVSGNPLGAIVVTDLESGATSVLIDRTDVAVHGLAFGVVDGRPVVASADDDHCVRLWDLTSMKLARVLKGHNGAVSAVAFGLADRRSVLVSGSADRTVRLWDPRTGDQLEVLADHAAPVTAATFVGLDNPPMLCTGGRDGIHVIQLFRMDLRGGPVRGAVGNA